MTPSCLYGPARDCRGRHRAASVTAPRHYTAPALRGDVGQESLRDTMARFEAWVLRRALERHGQRRIATARSLGFTREGLYKKLKRYGLQ